MADSPKNQQLSRDLGDEELVARVQSGDRGAYEILIERYQRKVLNVCFRLIGSGKDAKDLAADIFAEAYMSIKSFRGEAKFSTWLYRIALNTGYNRLRKVTQQRKRFAREDAREESELDGTSSKEPDPQEMAALSEDLEQIRAVLAKIPREHAKILMLHVVDGFSYVEISAMLQCPPGTVMSRLSRARDSFKKVWNKMYGKSD